MGPAVEGRDLLAGEGVGLNAAASQIQQQFGRAARQRPDQSVFDVPGPALEEFAISLKDHQALTTGTGRPNLLFAGMTVVEERPGAGEHPWAPFAGMFRDSPWFEDWRQAIADSRRAVDEDPSML